MDRVLQRAHICLLMAGAGGSVMPSQIDTLVKAEMARARIPAVAVAIVKAGKPIYLKGYGLANQEWSAACTPDTLFDLGSVSKQFTATAVMQLVEEEKVSLDLAARIYLPELPEAWKAVTVRQLLTHTSGIPSFTSRPNYFDTMRIRDELTRQQVLAEVASLPLDFEPDTRYSYNNTGYFLAMMLVEKVSGQSFAVYMKEKVFTPVGMTATRVNDLLDLVPKRAQGYSLGSGTLRRADFWSASQHHGAGGILSTAADMAKWDAALYTEKVLKRSSLEQMWTSAKLKSGAPTGYGFGWGVTKMSGKNYLGHSGGLPGWSTDISRFIDDKLTVIVLANRDSVSCGAIGAKIAALYFPVYAPKVVKPAAVDPEPEKTARFKDLVERMISLDVKPEEFSAEMQKALFPDLIKQASAQLKSLGSITSFAFIGKSTEGKITAYRYQVKFATVTLNGMFALDADDKVAGAQLSP